MDILAKIEKAKLIGRGGGCFPAAAKWEMVKKSKGREKYVVCNASEGEPGVKKDGYILNNFGEKVIDGVKLAMDFLEAEKGFIYLSHGYYKELNKKLSGLIGEAPIELFSKPVEGGYIGGEETAILNAIEEKRIEPRLRPPFPTTDGLWGRPTLVNNVETFYNVSLAVAGEYKKMRFYTVDGDCLWDGVYELPENYTIEKILKETNNYPKFPFFVQVGGGASGLVLNGRQLKRAVGGAGSITIYSMGKYNVKDLLFSWLKFFKAESCGQCTPCREGVYRLKEILNADDIDWAMFSGLLNNLTNTAFCGLGCAVPIPITSYINNVLPVTVKKKIDLGKGGKRAICECFK